MDLSNISQVAIVYNDKDVNKLLDNDWELLYVASYADTDERYASQGKVFKSKDLVSSLVQQKR